ncbi:putative adaptor protein complex AP-4, epsilon subunit [Helianthus annuus]|uniref:AP-4 complex subunit epsilon n=1 Tax=Helianthus annuus TaxID=4232 RepID=A0A251VC83_HELAN|nr:putative adaptor protein complex AP-4, epsilon subunit [Helianthus annuus]KAJ0774946.1 putative adaptor protein complex AP-4, epsilon subunit [Helianthus annuus]KAJ0944954.1 putative adaptor protein complex AP-4, epsilon subunit [Helianthus annuus]
MYACSEAHPYIRALTPENHKIHRTLSVISSLSSTSASVKPNRTHSSPNPFLTSLQLQPPLPQNLPQISTHLLNFLIYLQSPHPNPIHNPQLTLQINLEQLKTIGRELALGSHGSNFSQSKEFLDLVKSIGEARSKSEEDRIVIREIETLKRRINDPDTPKRKMKEYIIRLVYIEMLGHDASFGYIHAVKMTHDDSLFLKRTGYLAVTLFLNEDHDLIILIVNTIQKDLKSDNYLVVCAALNACCKLINEETIPAVVQQVVDLLGHAKEAVRKKAVMVLHRFFQKSPGSVNHLVSNFQKRLSDNDPGVMGATLFPLYDLITIDVNPYKDLVASFVNILKQVAERRLPKTYDYHQTPAPFIQIKLLKILALLGSGDKKSSEQMYTVIGDIMRKSDTASNIGNAILYECICCISSIQPSPKLLETAADAIANFLKSDSHNLKYMGIDALGRLIQISPDIAEQHQLAVIDCLEDPDDTLKRKTFELLYKMTKSSNVEVIVDRMIDYMISINDNHYKTETASRCVELAEQFAPSNHWFIQTMNKVFQHAGDLVNPKVAHNLMRLIAEGFGEDDDTADSQLRMSAVESYLKIVDEPKLPSAFLQVICWVLGEYGTADGKYSASYISGKLCDVAEAHSSDDTVKAYAVTALMKVYCFEKAAGRKTSLLPECQSLLEELSASHSADLQQRAYEFRAILDLDANAIENIMPLDASCEDIEIDTSLSFLDNYVQKAIEQGAEPYITENERSGTLNISKIRNHNAYENSTHSLRFEAYEVPKPVVPTKIPSTVTYPTDLVPVTATVSEPSYQPSVQPTWPLVPVSDAGSALGSTELKLRLDGVQKKWGKPTYSSGASSSSTSNFELDRTTVNGATKPDTAISKPREPRQSHAEVSEEKQKLAASLFGGRTSRSEKKQSGKVSRTTNHGEDKVQSATVTVPVTTAVQAQPHPPDLLDLGEPVGDTSSYSSTVDPFKQLEGLLDLSQDFNATAAGTSNGPDLMSLYSDTDTNGNPNQNLNPVNGSVNPSKKPALLTKGPSLKDALDKDALVRQMGVNPTGQNPNLFSDLLG